jgi:peptidoglycan hydrolase-like protein with peptidoglycan-binding domain
MAFRLPRHNRHLILRTAPLVAVVAVAALSTSCTSGSGAVQAESNEPAVTISVSPLPPSSLEITATTAAQPTTVAPTTTAAAPTTAATTTTAAPTTTAGPTTTLAPNVEIIGPAAAPLEAVGTRDGAATVAIQDRLWQLGFWHSGSDGEYGHSTKQAVMAFQKYLGLPSSGEVDQATADYLTAFPERAHGLADTGDLIEVDKVKQLLFVIRGGMTVLVLNTSTGNGLPYEEEDKNSPGELQTGVSITPDGLWKVNREREEGWWEGDLGEIYRPKYFRGGVAVHGSNSIPNYPASHGCVRVSVAAMDMIWALNLMPKGMTVWVHGG